jgi:hypothetical protein
MRNRTGSNAILPRWLWLFVARARRLIIVRECRDFRWRANHSSLINPILRVFIVTGFLASAAVDVHAAFDDLPISAQAAAMGGASLASQGDSAALFLNPAGVAGLRSPEAYLMYNQLYSGLSGVGSIGQGLITAGVPTSIGTVAVGFSNFQASGLLEERVFGVTFARHWLGSVEVGVTGKYFYHSYLIGSDPSAASDPVFNNGAARGAFALDVGLIAPVSSQLKVGLVVRNLNQPDVGLSTVDRVPREIQTGLAYEISPWALRLTADYTYSAFQSGSLSEQNQFGIGFEKGFVNDMVKLRLGATLDQFSGGVGIQLGPLGLDYTCILSRTVLANNAGTQMVGMRYRFGGAAQSPPRGN